MKEEVGILFDAGVATVTYYMRLKLYNHAVDECVKCKKKMCSLTATSNDIYGVFDLWCAVATGLAGDKKCAIRNIEMFLAESSSRQGNLFGFAAIAALLFFHNCLPERNYQLIEELQSQLSASERLACDESLLFGCQLFYFVDDFVNAKKLSMRIVGRRVSDFDRRMQICVAWVHLSSGDGDCCPKSLDEESLDAHLIRALILQKKNESQLALDYLNRALAINDTFAPALLEKANILIINCSWEEANECISFVLDNDDNLKALQLKSLVEIATVGRVNSIPRLSECIANKEPSCAWIYYQTSALIARSSRSMSDVQEIAIDMSKRACEMEPNNSIFLIEYAHCQQACGKVPSASQTYNEALNCDESSVEAICGVINCLILKGEYENAQQQLEFLEVMHDYGDCAPLVHFLRCLASQKRGGTEDQIYGLQREAIESQMSVMQRGHHDVVSFYITFNAKLAVDIANNILHHGVYDREEESSGSYECIDACVGLLQHVTSRIPAHFKAWALHSKANFILRRFHESTKSLVECRKINPKHFGPCLAIARNQIAQGDVTGALASLEEALSVDFSVQKQVLYQMLKAECFLKQGERIDEASQILTTACSLSRQTLSGCFYNWGEISDALTVRLLLSSALRRLEKNVEASEVLAQAREGFGQNKADVVQITLAESDLAQKSMKFEEAIELLNTIEPESSMFTKSQISKGKIYLADLNDKHTYIQCYEEIVARVGNSESFLLLGDAYMAINESDFALQAYENAMRMNPRNINLTIKFGNALLTLHKYEEALHHYENALRNMPDNTDLRYDLAKLYVKFGRPDEAVELLESRLCYLNDLKSRDATDATRMERDVSTLLLIADIYEECGSVTDLKAALERAEKIQASIIEKCMFKTSNIHQKRKAAAIFFKLAQVTNTQSHVIELYSRALELDPTNEKVLLELAKHFMKSNKLSECEKYCQKLSQNKDLSDEARSLIGDVKWLGHAYDEAVVHYDTVLGNKPNNYPVMAKYIHRLFKMGKPEKIQTLFEAALHNEPNSSNHVGLLFCKGLFYRFTNNKVEAVKHFNHARHDSLWKEDGIVNMIEIYTGMYQDDFDQNERVIDAESIIVVEKLFEELERTNHDVTRKKVLQSCFSIRRNSYDAEVLIDELVAILDADKNYVPALLTLATLFKLDDETKARNTLKRLTKMPFNYSHGSAFEHAYLMLARIYTERDGKSNLARDLCEKCIHINESSYEAYNMLGLIEEKEQCFEQASRFYRKSWDLGKHMHPEGGFKLAYNLFRSKSYLEVIEVCDEVLMNHPGYEIIREDILNRSIMCLRP
eukprot:CAMPEP_0116045132 /NCGR_PEP_ID=MMETSP0321-20121206/27421_1 /TAXON_ID=163516 /ORGANISM="Leptocylindrus danicus var. danicus, Strain B650" /LENGTH=1308 /DNA_ID=CAMNT_0003526377 /DNA_START=13 /DNA_END=3939 /DNA_ORIENTATION=+